MHKTILRTIQANNMLQKNDSIVMALSGGADSVALLHALITLQSHLKISKIFAAHINHGLRDSAIDDQNFVINLCKTMQIPLKIYSADIRTLAKEEHLTIEEAGRKQRYIFLNEACKYFDAAKIVTGHHQNDNAETVLLNLARGAGLRGLCGISYVNGNVIRPLLNVSRKEIEVYITKHHLQYVSDLSNFTHDYARDRIRHSVLPALEKATQPQVVQTIAKNAALLRADEDFLEVTSQRAFVECTCHYSPEQVPLTGNSPNIISINAQTLSTLHQAISSRVLRHAISQLTSLRNLTSTHIQSLYRLTQAKSGKEIHLPGLIARKEYSNIIITRPTPPYNMKEVTLSINSTYETSLLNMAVSISDTPPNNFLSPNVKNTILHCTKCFDYGIVIGEITLRTRRSGDKITLGTSRLFTKKLQDYFTDTKTPKHMRDKIPIIACGSDVLWVLDSRNTISAKYISSDTNKNLIWISLWRDTNA